MISIGAHRAAKIVELLIYLGLPPPRSRRRRQGESISFDRVGQLFGINTHIVIVSSLF